MKKTVLLTGIAALVATFSSCSLDEIKEVNQGTAIGFRTSFATRGIEAIGSYNLEKFYGTALTEDGSMYFENVLFAKAGDSYVSTPTYYWPKGENLWFYTYAPSIGEMGDEAAVTISKDVQKIMGYQVAANIDEQDDLIYASNTGTEDAGVAETAGNVALHFNHMLSRINVQATTTDQIYEYSFAGVRIGGVNMKGDVNLASKEWSHQASPGVCERTKGDDENPAVVYYNKQVSENPYSTWKSVLGELKNLSDNDRSNYAFMIPQEFTAWDPVTDPTNSSNGAYISVLVQINTHDGVRIYPSDEDEDGYGWVAVPLPAGEWQAGYAYNYTLDFTNGAGYVDPTEPDGGKDLLGESIKITMSMNAMEDAETGVVVNKEMIGIWKAYSYVYTYSKLNGESGEYVEDESRRVTYTDIEEIGRHTDNFASVEIIDGTKLWTKRGEERLSSDYYVDEDNLMYIETYKENDEYTLIPKIAEIIPVSENGDGKAVITVTGGASDGSWKDAITIEYTISPLTD